MMDAERPLADRHVLLIEDDYFIMDELRQSFEHSGAVVLGPVGSMAEALDLTASTTRIDAAVLDINLHGEMAFPVADALRARGVPFIFVTGYGQAKIPQRHGDTAHFEKPVEPDLVARLIAVLADGADGLNRVEPA